MKVWHILLPLTTTPKLCHDRATHHLISGEILKQDVTLRQWFNEIEIETMKEAVEDHGHLRTMNLGVFTEK